MAIVASATCPWLPAACGASFPGREAGLLETPAQTRCYRCGLGLLHRGGVIGYCVPPTDQRCRHNVPGSSGLDATRLDVHSAAASSDPFGKMFLRGWVAITGVEMLLLGVTVALPREWTGWSSTFVQDGLDHLGRAYTNPPVWDDDHWFHNYLGHPYGGSVYYNTVRCQGASPVQSFVFSAALSVQWEYVFEAVAEQPSIQDLLITPVAGSLLGEVVNQATLAMKQNGTNILEKAFILIMNPMSILFVGFN